MRARALRAWAGAGALSLVCSFARAASVDAWDAVWEARGIEVRDAYNQVVSRDSLVRDLRQGGAALEREAASLSALKALAFLLDYLDHLGLGAVVRGPSRPPLGRLEAVSVSLRELKLRPPSAAVWLRTILHNDYYLPAEDGLPCLAAGLRVILRC